jgi:splicing factor 3A subunit 3
LHEFIIINLCGAISDIVTATRRHALKQQTRTLEEKEAEIAEEEFGYLHPEEGAEGGDGAEEVGGDDEPIYNPLNLPLGWDGKPIPFWLYKLHGLGIEYKCEICGNFSYWGRRAFDKHFQEWRHAHGMRCLGIPNTKHFHDITLIEDALALHNKIKHTLKVEQYNSAQDEEFEDSEGNVLNRRTYEDLARQGLL